MQVQGLLIFAIFWCGSAVAQVGPDKTAIITYKTNACTSSYELNGSARVDSPCETFSGRTVLTIFWAKSNKIFVNYRGGWGTVSDLNKENVPYAFVVPASKGVHSKEEGSVSVTSSNRTQLHVKITQNTESTEDNPSYFTLGSSAVRKAKVITEMILSSSDGLHCQFNLNYKLVSRSKRTASSEYRIMEGSGSSAETTCLLFDGNHLDKKLD